MSVLRIRGVLDSEPLECQWVLMSEGGEARAGDGPLTGLPRGAGRVELLVPAAQVLLTRARVPQAARRHTGQVLAYAVEDDVVGDSELNHVSWLGTTPEGDVLAVVDQAGLTRWCHALSGVGVHDYEVHCETLLLPWQPGEVSLAWDGMEGFARTGPFEGGATDAGDARMPPLSLRLLLDEAVTGSAAGTTIALYTNGPESLPDIKAWTRELGVAVRPAGPWDWRTASSANSVGLARQRRRWGGFGGVVARLRPAAWILGAAVVINAAALALAWAMLASEQRSLRQQMESRFRAAFPEAVAVVNPELQLRRNLAEVRRAAGQPDSGDFLQMIVPLAEALKDISPATVRVVSYDNGRLMVELAAVDEPAIARIVGRLARSGLRADVSRGGAPATNPAGGATVVLTVRPA